MSIFNKTPPIPKGKVKYKFLQIGIEENPRLWSIGYHNLKKEPGYREMQRAWSFSFLFFILIYFCHLEDEDTKITYEL